MVLVRPEAIHGSDLEGWRGFEQGFGGVFVVKADDCPVRCPHIPAGNNYGKLSIHSRHRCAQVLHLPTKQAMRSPSYGLLSHPRAVTSQAQSHMQLKGQWELQTDAGVGSVRDMLPPGEPLGSSHHSEGLPK